MTKRNLIRLSKSCIGQDEIDAVQGVLEREYLGMGIEVGLFEKGLENFFKRPAICVGSGTAALQLALQALNLDPGDEVLVPSLTFVASFQAIKANQLIPIACDIEEGSLTMNWKDAEDRITKKTRVIMPVHYSGGVGNLDSIYSLSNRYNLRIIEDAAHAFGTTYKGRRVGGFGDVACFSFDGIKNITSGEGGCVVSNDDSFLKIIKDARLLGVENDSENRIAGKRSWKFDVNAQGWRYHMSNIMAAIGIEQLKKQKYFAQKRQLLALKYQELLSGNEKINLINHNYSEVVPHIFTIRIKDLINRDILRARFLEAGIETGVHYLPNHYLSFFKSSVSAPLPNTEGVYDELLTLPLHPDLAIDDVEFVCQKLEEFLD